MKITTNRRNFEHDVSHILSYVPIPTKCLVLGQVDRLVWVLTLVCVALQLQPRCGVTPHHTTRVI